MPSTLDLPAYLARIGYSGPTNPDHATLAGLLAAHMNTIHFENIDVLLGRPIRLDLDSLQRKIVREKRGGYCFEQTTLFDAALRAIGFATRARSARVTYLLPASQAPRTHMFLQISLPEGEFVADPGFGGFACRTPIPLGGDSVAEGAEQYRIALHDGYRCLEVADERKTVRIWAARFDDDQPIDFELGNHWTSMHPLSHFRQRLMLRAITPERRLTVMNRDVTIREAGGVRTLKLADRAALRALLRDQFGFDCPDVETMDIPSAPDWT